MAVPCNTMQANRLPLLALGHVDIVVSSNRTDQSRLIIMLAAVLRRLAGICSNILGVSVKFSRTTPAASELITSCRAQLRRLAIFSTAYTSVHRWQREDRRKYTVIKLIPYRPFLKAKMSEPQIETARILFSEGSGEGRCLPNVGT